MVLPKTIRIFHLVYQVKLVTPDTLGDCLGDIDTEKQIIRISNALSAELEFDTFLHEVLHAYCNLLGIEDDEQICSVGATVLSNLLQSI